MEIVGLHRRGGSVSAIAPEGEIPEWRIRTDFLAEFAEIPELGPIGAVR